ncbi:MAG: RluA family pseudouridine synthase [Rhodospirillales bacterium]
MTETLRAKVNTEEVGKRIDRFLADSWPDISRARITNLIVEGHVSRENNSTVFRPSDKTREYDIFVATLPSPTAADPLAEAIDLNVVYEDQDVIVIDKPAGMTVHPAPGQQTGTLVNALLAYCGDSLSGIGGVKRPGIVHRIDKDTSGLLVVAKTDIAHQGLAKQFHEHSVERAYTAYVLGLPSPTNNTIETTIGRHKVDRKRMAVGGNLAKKAITHYSVIESYGFSSAKLECRLETGRTHQIRVHMAHIGWPLIGDPVYGKVIPSRRQRLNPEAREFVTKFPRQALHARLLGFVHPLTSEPLSFISQLPTDLAKLEEILVQAT